MKAACFHQRGGSEALVIDDVPMPEPAEGEVLIQVHAAGVTPTELLWMPTWSTPEGNARPFPIIPGHEVSGIVRRVGSGVTTFSPGDAVFGMNDWFGNGAQAEYCVARVAEIAAKPASIDHALAAISPISGLTAWQGLIDRARLARGERVLIHGGAGGVGSFAVQIASWRGAEVIATASAHNLDFVRNLGAEEVIDYQADSFLEAVGCVDVVFDTVGGETLARSWDALKPGGRMVTIAASGEAAKEPRVKDAFFIVEPNAEQLANLAAMVVAGQIRPVDGEVFSLEEASQAYLRKPTRGKNVILIA